VSASNSSNGRPVRAVAYYRKSNEDEGESVGQQKAWADAQCPGENIEILREFTDQAVAGHDTKRRADFHAMLKFCQEQSRLGTPVACIVTWNPNRLSRSESFETGYYLHQFMQTGTHLLFTASHGWKDLNRMEDRILFNIEQDATHHRYVKDLSQAATRGHLAAALAGRWNGGPPPYGYRLEYEFVIVGGRRRRVPVKLVPFEEEAYWLRWMFREYAGKDVSLKALALRLNELGAPAPLRNRGGQAPLWDGNSVRFLLRNRKYLGDMLYGERCSGKFFGVVKVGVGNEAACDVRPLTRPGRNERKSPEQAVLAENRHEPLIDPDTFERVQRKMAERQTRTTPKPNGGDFVLSGLLRCGHCGGVLIGRTNRYRVKADGTRPFRLAYFCSTYHCFGSGACSFNSIGQKKLLTAIARKVREDLPRRLDALREEIRRQSGRADADDHTRIVVLEKKLEKPNAQVSRASHRLATEENEDLLPALREALEGLITRRQTADELAALHRPPAEREEAEARIDAALAELEHLDAAFIEGEPALVREALRALVSHVELFWAHEEKEGQKSCRFARGLMFFREDGKGVDLLREEVAGTTQSLSATGPCSATA
jgi:DNA invertase Pin-like site-specific DNA recombinase